MNRQADNILLNNSPPNKASLQEKILSPYYPDKPLDNKGL